MRLVGEPGSPERRKQPISGAITGENAARAVAAVSGRCETEHKHPRRGIAEPRQWSPPVALGREGRAFDLGRFFAPGDEPRTASAARDLAIERRESPGSVHAPSTLPYWRS
jgi:hypothetical protein